MSIHWIRNVLVEGEKTTIELRLGDRKIGDRCYFRIGTGLEQWFPTESEDRDQVTKEGIEKLKEHLKGKKLNYPDGRPYDWK